MSTLVIRFSAVAVSTKNITFFDFFQQFLDGFSTICCITYIEFLFRMNSMVKLKNDRISFTTVNTWMFFQVFQNCQLYQSSIFSIGYLGPFNVCGPVGVIVPPCCKRLILLTDIWHCSTPQ